MTVSATKENWPAVMEAIEALLDSVCCAAKTRFQILTAAEEIFVNIASYAYGENTGMVQIEPGFDEMTGIFSISFADSGVPYNPLEQEDTDITLSAEERNLGGLGILMVKKTMDDIKYRYEAGQNHIMLMKKCC